MTTPFSFVAEGRRLGIQAPYIPTPGNGGQDTYADGLCVTGCYSCRAFRNKVRAALEAERQPGYDDGYNTGWDEGFELGRVIGARDMLLGIIEPLQQGLRDLEDIPVNA